MFVKRVKLRQMEVQLEKRGVGSAVDKGVCWIIASRDSSINT